MVSRLRKGKEILPKTHLFPTITVLIHPFVNSHIIVIATNKDPLLPKKKKDPLLQYIIVIVVTPIW